MAEHGALLFVALVLDWFVGDPKWLWQRVSHPVVVFGAAVSKLDELLNDASDIPATAMRKGAVAIVLLISGALTVGMMFDWLIAFNREIGWLVEVVVIWVILAQKSLLDHVGDVAMSLREDGIEGGRKAVGMIVGRDPNLLDESGVSRAAIESLAENFGDGVVAPAFWYLVFGLPGLLVYKMINTADSMIAYRNEKYLHFGRVSAQIDDLANWLPARISAVLIALGAAAKYGVARGRDSILVALRDAGLHRSPNAGWPEAAMAGGCDLALGGPRIYEGMSVSQAFINGAGRRDLRGADIVSAMAVFSNACYFLWGVVLIWWLIF